MMQLHLLRPGAAGAGAAAAPISALFVTLPAPIIACLQHDAAGAAGAGAAAAAAPISALFAAAAAPISALFAA